ncbi:hypothetical protein [Glaciecola sp. SC05]|uniref:hypothetical protein n=1 Tax=Glaciecola sp. SC05 TaxID=1987355 RepID=UPI0035289FC9
MLVSQNPPSSTRYWHIWTNKGSPITANNSRAPPVEALEQTVMFDNFTIQRDFDFTGAVTDA